jgi:uncharacterized protein (DUF2461 family)
VRGLKYESSGYYFHLEPPNILLGVRIHIFSKNLLNAYWKAVVDPDAGSAPVKAVRKVSANGDCQLGGEQYKREPRGYDPKHPHAELMCDSGLTAGRKCQSQRSFILKR